MSGQNDWCLVIWRFGPQSHADESEDVFRLSSLVRWKFQEVAHVCYSNYRSWDQYKVIALVICFCFRVKRYLGEVWTCCFFSSKSYGRVVGKFGTGQLGTKTVKTDNLALKYFWDNFQQNQGAWSQLSSPITVLSYLWAVGWVIENNPIVTFRFLQPSTSEELCGSQIFALEQLGSAMGHLSTTKCTLQKTGNHNNY